MAIELVPLDKIKENEYNPRSTYNKDRLDELVKSIMENGLLQTPKARRLKDGTVELGFGTYRFRAMKIIAEAPEKDRGPGVQSYVVDGQVTMPLEISEIGDESMPIIAIEENVKRDTMSPMDTARAVAKYFEIFPQAKETALAQKLGLTQPVISNMRRVTNLPESVLAYLNDGSLNYTQGRELCTLQDIDATTAGKVKSEPLMLEAIKLIGTQSIPRTLEGLKMAIHAVISAKFASIDADAQKPPEFDTKTCSKCKKMVKTTKDNGKPSRHCLDEECFKLKQDAAVRVREEAEKERAAEAERVRKEEEEKKRAAEEARLAEEAAKEKIIEEARLAAEKEAASRKTETSGNLDVIRVFPGRLTDQGDIGKSYSAINIFRKEDIAPPFTEGGDSYISVGDYPEVEGAKHGYKIVPRANYTGVINSVFPTEGESVEEHRKNRLADPLGPFNGVLVTRQGQEFVMVGPVKIWAPELDTTQATPDKKKEEKKKDAPRKVEKSPEPPAGAANDNPGAPPVAKEGERESTPPVGENTGDQPGETVTAKYQVTVTLPVELSMKVGAADMNEGILELELWKAFRAKTAASGELPEEFEYEEAEDE